MIDEQDSVRRCQRGDREAFRPLVERYGDVLMGTLYLMTRDRAVSEELVQETFLRAWKSIGRFRLGSPLKPWLVRIAVNLALDAKSRALPVEPLEEAEQGGPDPELSRADDKEAIRRALGQLADEQRRVVILRYFAELSTGEAAEVLGVREGTVKSRLSRSLERLRLALSD